jgi:hypothetical protein
MRPAVIIVTPLPPIERSQKLWQAAATGGFVGLLALGIFAQSAQRTKADSLSPVTCSELQSLCAQPQGTPGTQEACSLSALYCGSGSQSSSSSSLSSPQACIARCSDGYEYRTCTEDGYPINYFVDACRSHSPSSSFGFSSANTTSTPSYCINANPVAPSGCTYSGCRYDQQGCYTGGCLLSCGNASSAGAFAPPTPSYCANANPPPPRSGCSYSGCRYDARGCYQGGCLMHC